jgi:hypothetical protein
LIHDPRATKLDDIPKIHRLWIKEYRAKTEVLYALYRREHSH